MRNSPGQAPADAIPPGWRYARRIALLPLPAELRPERDHALDELGLDDSQQAIAGALAALADAMADSRDTLEPGQEAAVRRLLAFPLPERQPSAPAVPGQGPAAPASRRASLCPGISRRPSRQPGMRPSSAPTLPARYTGSPAADPLRQYSRVRAQLTALGYEDPEPSRAPLGAGGISVES